MTSSREDRIAALPAHLQEALRRRMAGTVSRAPEIPAAADRSGPVPLSSAQRRLWFFSQLRPDDPEYNSAFALRLTGELDVEALATALRLLVARHEPLRTTFEEVDGEPRQLIQPPDEVALPVLDAAPEDLDAVLKAEYSRPFDLVHGPLLRAVLVRLGRAEHVLLVCVHHIATDGASMGVLTEELGLLYRDGERAELPPQPLQYADFAVWQHNRPTRAAGLEHWTRQLTGVTPLDLPTDRPRPAARSTAGAVREFAVPSDVARGLAELARTSETTLFTVLLAACQALFARCTGQEDIALGTVVSGRDRPELERVVGFFVNTVVLRSDVDRSAPFADHLAAARQTVLDAFAHDDVPFEEVVDAVHAGRDPGRNPLFDVMVLLHTAAGTGPVFPGLAAEPAGVGRDSANFDLTVEFEESGGSTGRARRIQHRTVRGRDDRPADRASAAAAGRDRRRPGQARRRPAADHRDRGSPAARLAWPGARRHRRCWRHHRRSPRPPSAHPVEAATALVCGDVRLSFAELAARTDVLAAELMRPGRGAGQGGGRVAPALGRRDHRAVRRAQGRGGAPVDRSRLARGTDRGAAGRHAAAWWCWTASAASPTVRARPRRSRRTPPT